MNLKWLTTAFNRLKFISDAVFSNLSVLIVVTARR